MPTSTPAPRRILTAARAVGQVGLLPFKDHYLIEEYDKLPNFFKVFLEAMAQRMRSLMEKVTLLAGNPKILELLDEEANENSGLVQATPEEGNYPLFAVSWIRTWQWGLEGSLEAGFVGIENWAGIVNITKGNVVETTKTGHRMLYQEGHSMLYQYYTATTETQGEIVYGVVGAFYCPDTQRTFSLVTMQKSTTGSSAQEALAYFEGYVDAFVCH